MKIFVCVFAFFCSLLSAECMRDMGWSYPGAAKQQMEYFDAVRQYKETWAESDIIRASALALTTPNAAWPFVNGAYHIINSKGDLKKAAIYLREAKKIVGEFPGQPADSVRAAIKGDCQFIADRGIECPAQ